MASFFDTRPNASLLSQIGQNQARAGQYANNVGNSISQVGDIFTNYSKAQEQAAQRELENERAQQALELNQAAGVRADANLILNQNAEERAASNQLFNQALKDPNSKEFKALQAAQNAQFEEQQRIRNRNTIAKPTFTDLYKKTEDGGVQSISVPAGQVNDYTKQGFNLGSYTAPKKDKNFASNAKVKEDISNIIGSTGNSADIVNAYNKYKQAGGSDKQFKNALLQVGGGNLEDKGYLDFGNKDLDVSSILEQAKKAEGSGNKRPNVPYQKPAGTTETPTTSKKFVEPSQGRTLLKSSIVNDIKGLRNPIFGSGIIDSSIKAEIDAKYGEGAYEKYNTLTK